MPSDGKAQKRRKADVAAQDTAKVKLEARLGDIAATFAAPDARTSALYETSSRLFPCVPYLQLKGHGLVPLFLTSALCQELQEQGKTGGGEQMCACWGPESYSFGSPDWDDSLQRVVTSVKAGLELPEVRARGAALRRQASVMSQRRLSTA